MTTFAPLVRCGEPSQAAGVTYVRKWLDEAVRRRRWAARLLLAGKTPAQAAASVDVARQTAYTWKAVLDEGSIDVLRAMPARGRPARLDDGQLQVLARALPQGPTARGLRASCNALHVHLLPSTITDAISKLETRVLKENDALRHYRPCPVRGLFRPCTLRCGVV